MKLSSCDRMQHLTVRRLGITKVAQTGRHFITYKLAYRTNVSDNFANISVSCKGGIYNL